MARWYQNLTWKVLIKLKTDKLWEFHNVQPEYHGEFPDPPYIFMGNHSHAEDPYIIGAEMGDIVHFMANIDGVSDVQRILSHMVACYGKKKGAPDFAAIKKTIELLKEGEPVGIFPEGDRSWDGETAPLIPGSTAIASKYKYPIVLAVQRGNYLSFPRWADNPRQGRIKIDYYTFTAEDVGSMTPQELEQKVTELLYVNDVKDPVNKDITFKGKDLASGIQRLLWVCPSCGKQDSIAGDGDDILCRACGAKWTLDGSLRIQPEGLQGRDLKDWYDWQKEKTAEIISAAGDDLITSTVDIELSELENRKMVDPRRGDMKLYRDRIVFSSPGREDLVMQVSDVAHYIDNFNNAFEFDCGKTRYRLKFSGKNALKWIDLLNQLKK
ncbi:MAG: 1-acyl-sn-glycerol-3-phosphate acyltransferase [Spirochaetales bacterium]|nr:1-acyl-sn-glycerol-3-phosphate acyltransferase [Spirochaetales bacterium]